VWCGVCVYIAYRYEECLVKGETFFPFFFFPGLNDRRSPPPPRHHSDCIIKLKLLLFFPVDLQPNQLLSLYGDWLFIHAGRQLPAPFAVLFGAVNDSRQTWRPLSSCYNLSYTCREIIRASKQGRKKERRRVFQGRSDYLTFGGKERKKKKKHWMNG
jgi:hypothetical protein